IIVHHAVPCSHQARLDADHACHRLRRWYRSKGYLKLMGQQGNPSDYETLLMAIRSEVKRTASDKMRAQSQGDHVTSGLALTTSALERGPLFVLDATIDDALIYLLVHG